MISVSSSSASSSMFFSSSSNYLSASSSIALPYPSSCLAFSSAPPGLPYASLSSSSSSSLSSSPSFSFSSSCTSFCPLSVSLFSLSESLATSSSCVSSHPSLNDKSTKTFFCPDEEHQCTKDSTTRHRLLATTTQQCPESSLMDGDICEFRRVLSPNKMTPSDLSSSSISRCLNSSFSNPSPQMSQTLNTQSPDFLQEDSIPLFSHKDSFTHLPPLHTSTCPAYSNVDHQQHYWFSSSLSPSPFSENRKARQNVPESTLLPSNEKWMNRKKVRRPSSFSSSSAVYPSPQCRVSPPSSTTRATTMSTSATAAAVSSASIDNATLSAPNSNASSDGGILLIDYGERLVVGNDSEFADRLGCSINSKVKVVSIFGNTGEGKSHSLNEIFFQSRQVFCASPNQHDSTAGVWASFWHDPSGVFDDALILDTEGLLGVCTNEAVRARMLLKILGVSDVIIFRKWGERMTVDAFRFINEASTIYLKHFSPELRRICDHHGLPAQLLGPALLIFHETRWSVPLGLPKDNSKDDFLRSETHVEETDAVEESAIEEKTEQKTRSSDTSLVSPFTRSSSSLLQTSESSHYSRGIITDSPVTECWDWETKLLNKEDKGCSQQGERMEEHLIHAKSIKQETSTCPLGKKEKKQKRHQRTPLSQKREAETIMKRGGKEEERCPLTTAFEKTLSKSSPEKVLASFALNRKRTVRLRPLTHQKSHCNHCSESGSCSTDYRSTSDGMGKSSSSRCIYADSSNVVMSSDNSNTNSASCRSLRDDALISEENFGHFIVMPHVGAVMSDPSNGFLCGVSTSSFASSNSSSCSTFVSSVASSSFSVVATSGKPEGACKALTSVSVSSSNEVTRNADTRPGSEDTEKDNSDEVAEGGISDIEIDVCEKQQEQKVDSERNKHVKYLLSQSVRLRDRHAKHGEKTNFQEINECSIPFSADTPALLNDSKSDGYKEDAHAAMIRTPKASSAMERQLGGDVCYLSSNGKVKAAGVLKSEGKEKEREVRVTNSVEGGSRLVSLLDSSSFIEVFNKYYRAAVFLPVKEAGASSPAENIPSRYPSLASQVCGTMHPSFSSTSTSMSQKSVEKQQQLDECFRRPVFEAFCCVEYVGICSADRPTDFSEIRDRVRQFLRKDATGRVARPVRVVHAILEHLTSKFSCQPLSPSSQNEILGKSANWVSTSSFSSSSSCAAILRESDMGHASSECCSPSLGRPLPFEAYFRCPSRCKACGVNCSLSMNHEGYQHKPKTTHRGCRYRSRLDNRVMVCLRCWECRGEALRVDWQNSSSQDSAFQACVSYVSRGPLLECSNCGIIYQQRSGLLSSTSQSPVEAGVVQLQILHCWSSPLQEADRKSNNQYNYNNGGGSRTTTTTAATPMTITTCASPKSGSSGGNEFLKNVTKGSQVPSVNRFVWKWLFSSTTATSPAVSTLHPTARGSDELSLFGSWVPSMSQWSSVATTPNASTSIEGDGRSGFFWKSERKEKIAQEGGKENINEINNLPRTLNDRIVLNGQASPPNDRMALSGEVYSKDHPSVGDGRIPSHWMSRKKTFPKLNAVARGAASLYSAVGLPPLSASAEQKNDKNKKEKGLQENREAEENVSFRLQSRAETEAKNKTSWLAGPRRLTSPPLQGAPPTCLYSESQKYEGSENLFMRRPDQGKRVQPYIGATSWYAANRQQRAYDFRGECRTKGVVPQLSLLQINKGLSSSANSFSSGVEWANNYPSIRWSQMEQQRYGNWQSADRYHMYLRNAYRMNVG